MERIIQLHDKQFVPFISEKEISETISALGKQINSELKGQNPLFLGVLNGSFMFMADLIREYQGDCFLSFIKVASYQGTQTTGKVKELIGLNTDLAGRTIIIVEDIVDTGNTLEYTYNELLKLNPKVIKVAALLLKPTIYSKRIKIDYVGKEIPDKFIVGYGLDYNELGRNLKDIFVVKT